MILCTSSSSSIKDTRPFKIKMLCLMREDIVLDTKKAGPNAPM